MLNIWVVPAVMLLLAALSPLLAWWGSTRYFAGKWEGIQIETTKWRDNVERRLTSIEDKLEASSYAVLNERMRRAEHDINDLRTWKHERADPLIGEIGHLGDRLSRLEK